VQIESAATPVALEGDVPARTLTGRRTELLALPPGPSVLIQRRSLILVAAAVVIVVGLSTVIAVTGGFTKNQPEAAAVTQPQIHAAPATAPAESPKSQLSLTAAVVKPKKQSKQDDKPEEKPAAEPMKEPEPSAQSIKVVMQIENGRVLKASIANPRPGMDSYEALALRIARQRRYPTTQTGGETITINVNK